MLEKTKLTFYRLLSVILLTALLSISGVMYVSAHGGDVTLIHACVSNRNGAVRIVSPATACDANKETALDWGIQGPKGDKGDVGAQGEKGDTGAQEPMGPQGPQGVPGTSSLPQAMMQVFQGVNITTGYQTPASIGTISLPPGRWTLFATVKLIMSSRVDEVIHTPSAFCWISNAYGLTGEVNPGLANNFGGFVTYDTIFHTLSLQYLVNPSSTQDFTLQCASGDTAAFVRVDNASIMAIQVAP